MFKKKILVYVYKLLIKEDEDVFSSDDLLLYFNDNSYCHMEVIDNKLITNNIDDITDINISWDNDNYEILTNLISEFNNIEIVNETCYYQGSHYNFAREFLDNKNNFIFGLVLGFDEIEYISDKIYFIEVINSYRDVRILNL